MPDRERLKLFNKLCKTCSRHRVIPKSMHVPDCSEGSVEIECGGFANVSQSTYEGCRVAVKVVCMYVTSDAGLILSVSLLPAPPRLSEQMDCRGSVVRVLPGNTSGIPTFCRSSE